MHSFFFLLLECLHAMHPFTDQDEKTAVLNVASYGPAAVCLEASLWQDYEGGIMTSSIGCSNSFLDMK